MVKQTPEDKRQKAKIRKRNQREREKSGSQVSTSSAKTVVSDEERAAQRRENARIRKQRSRAKQAASRLSQVTLQYCNSVPVIISLPTVDIIPAPITDVNTLEINCACQGMYYFQVFLVKIILTICIMVIISFHVCIVGVHDV